MFSRLEAYYETFSIRIRKLYLNNYAIYAFANQMQLDTSAKNVSFSGKTLSVFLFNIAISTL